MMTSTMSRQRGWRSNSRGGEGRGEGGGGEGGIKSVERCRLKEMSEDSDIVLCPQKLLDKLLMVCPNAEFCQEVLPRSDLQSHLINRCKGVLTNCINASIGCSFQSTGAALQRHLDECLYNDKGRLCWLSGSPQLLPAPRRRTLRIYTGQSSLGISIVGGIDTPLVSVIVQEVFQNGAAYKDGRLQAGDQILEVNGVDLRRVTHEGAVEAMVGLSAVLQLTVFRESSKDDSSVPTLPPLFPNPFPTSTWKNSAPNSQDNDNWTNDKETQSLQRQTVTDDKSEEEEEEEEEEENENEAEEGRRRLSIQHHHQQQQQQVPQLQHPSVVSSSMELQQQQTMMMNLSWPLEEWTERTINVTNMASDSLGISIAGGRFSCGYDVPIYVTNIQTNGILALTGQIAKGDILLAINETSLLNLSHNEAAEVLKCSTDLNWISLLVIRSKLIRFTRPGNFKPDWKFWLSLPCVCYSTKTLTLERSTSGSLGFAIVGGYETTSPSSSPPGMTSFVPIFVRSVVHNGPAAKDGRLRSGDMIVAVNDTSLERISHSDAVRLLTIAGSEELNSCVTLTVVSWPGTPV